MNSSTHFTLLCLQEKHDFFFSFKKLLFCAQNSVLFQVCDEFGLFTHLCCWPGAPASLLLRFSTLRPESCWNQGFGSQDSLSRMPVGGPASPGADHSTWALS